MNNQPKPTPENLNTSTPESQDTKISVGKKLLHAAAATGLAAVASGVPFPDIAKNLDQGLIPPMEMNRGE